MDRLIYLSMSGAKATMQRQETLANNLANVIDDRLSRRARRVPRGAGAKAAARARASTRSSRRPATTPTPGPVAADRPRPRRRDEGQRLARGAGARRHRGLHPRRRARGQRRRQAVTTRRPDRARRRRPDPGAAGQRRSASRADGTVSAHGGQRPPHAGRQAQAGDARGAAARAATDGLFRAADGDLAGRPERRACRTARSKAATSTRSRPWSR